VARFFVICCRTLPRFAALGLGRTVGVLAWVCSTTSRRHAESAVAHVAASTDRLEPVTTVKRCFRHYGSALSEAVRLNKGVPPITWHGIQHLDSARRRGRGVILVTGHLGNWEVAATGLGAIGRPITLVVAGMHNPMVDDLVTSIRRESGVEVIERRQLRQAARKLERGEVVGTAADQHPVGRSVQVNFFGEPIEAAIGPAWLTHRTGAPLMSLFAPRVENGSYRVDIRPVWDGDSPLPSVEHLSQVWMGRLEAYVTRYPTQWLWMHRRWREKT